MTRDSEAFKKEIAAVEEEIKRLERQEEERAEKQIQLDEEIDVKSKLIEREILQAQKNKKDPDEKEEDKYISPLILRLQEYEMPPATDKNSKADTGYVSAPKVPRISAISFGGMLRETFARHMNARWEHQMETHGFTYKNMFNRMWSMDQVDSGRKEAMTRDLKIIEDRTASRITRMNELSLKKAGGNITVSEERQLRTLEKEEISRYWMRQTLINDLNLPEQEKMNWLRPIGDGAYGVLPFTIVTQWDKLDLSQKGGVRWMYDNVLIRWQRALYGGFVPKAAKLSWFKKQKTKGVEQLFDDMDEEIYSEKKFKEMVKKGTAQLEDMEEELSGYDRFTVSEEKEIQKRVAAIMKDALETAKEEEHYG